MELIALSLILGIIGLLVYCFIQWMSHFEKLGIEFERPVPILGNMAPVLLRRSHIVEHLQRLHNKYADRKYFGFYDFTNPVVVIRDPELITSIAVKNFDSFIDHRNVVDERLDPLMGQNLFSLRGDKWREVRRLLSPAFTSSKMKMMYGLICDCAENFIGRLHPICKGGKEMDLKEIFCRYTNDVVATCAFGISIDSMQDPNNDFYLLGRKAITFDTILSLKFMVGRNFPGLMSFFKIRMFSQDVTKFFTDIVKATVKVREEKNIYRPDMIQLMMEARKNANSADLSIEEMTAQAFVFFFAGFDATASFISYLTHMLGVNPEVQEKLRAEIMGVLRENKGRPSYEVIHQMKYMDAVLNETLRYSPAASFLDRVCIKEFELPPSAPGADPVILKPGDGVWFAPYSIQHDPQYYSEPDKFNPDRFLDAHTDPALFLPFGIGPRICIGNRFALMETKILMFYLLANYNLTPSAKTTLDNQLNRSNLQIMPRTGFWMNLTSKDQLWLPSKKDETVATNGNACTK